MIIMDVTRLPVYRAESKKLSSHGKRRLRRLLRRYMRETKRETLKALQPFKGKRMAEIDRGQMVAALAEAQQRAAARLGI